MAIEVLNTILEKKMIRFFLSKEECIMKIMIILIGICAVALLAYYILILIKGDKQ